MRKGSTLDYFSRTNPATVFPFWRRHKIHSFLAEKVDDGASLIKAKDRRNKREMPFGRNWLEDDYFLALFAFLKMLNEDKVRMNAFFSDFLNGFYPSDQEKVQAIAEAAYCAVNNKLYRYLHLGDPAAPPSENAYTNKNPFGFGLLEGQSIQNRVNVILGEYRGEKPNSNYCYARDELKSLMSGRVYKEHPVARVKRVVGYVLAGIFFAATALALGYLTLQTAGLIHLLWVVPVACLAVMGGACALGGIVAAVKSTPSISNRLSQFFRDEEKPANPINGELFTNPDLRLAGLML